MVNFQRIKESIWQMCGLLKEFQRFLREWHMRTPKQKWLIVYLVGAKTSEAIGITVYGDMQIYWYTYMPGLMGSMHIFLTIYTMWFNFKDGYYKKGMECTCSIGFAISVGEKRCGFCL